MGLVGAAAVIHALYKRANGDMTYDIDTSLTQYNIWYYRLGQYTEAQQKLLRERNKGFSVRHYDEMSSLIMKTYAATRQCRPDLFTNPGYFTKMSGEGWGIEDSIYILKPAFTLGKTKLGNMVPSGKRGRSLPKWDGEDVAESSSGNLAQMDTSPKL
jgi:hypothetical protein